MPRRYISQRRHKLVVRYLDGRILKGTTYKLDTERKGFYLICVNPLPGHEEVMIEFDKVKGVFYVKDFDGKPVQDDEMEEYIPEGHEITVKFKDGEVIHGFALHYSESSPTFFVDIADPSENTYVALVNRAACEEITLGRIFRAKQLHTLVDTPVKMLLLREYCDHPGETFTLSELAETIERTFNSVKRDIVSFVDEGLAEYVECDEGQAVKFVPTDDDETREFIMTNLPRCRQIR